MPLSEFKLREIWRGSSAGHEIPQFVIEGGRGGRFDAALAEQYALRCSTLSKTAFLRKEGPRLLAQFKATRSVPDGERVRYNKFLVTTLRTVEELIDRSRRQKFADSEERNKVFSRYAAFLNFVEVQGGRRFSLVGLSPNTSSVPFSPSPSFSLAARSQEEKVKGRRCSVAGSISGLTPDRHALYQAKYQQYRDEFGLDDNGSETEPEQGYLEAEIDRFLKELDQGGDIQDPEKSSRRLA
ncbi:uncharacterized protein BDW70DRAFT_170737 [Aspergillus foveolatus]|uniref:uncharacterized protein n=1 Tax=Aspergillus foveolatus TaxID=210207 RepID=UPI003CCE0F59